MPGGDSIGGTKLEHQNVNDRVRRGLELDLRRPCLTETSAEKISRGVCRVLKEMGFQALTEMPLGIGRRVDVIGLNGRGNYVIVETKTNLADFRSDQKWRDYLPYCDLFYFAVGEGFPHDILPKDCGSIVADRYGGEVVRRAPTVSMVASFRRKQTIRFARCTASQLRRLEDPPY